MGSPYFNIPGMDSNFLNFYNQFSNQQEPYNSEFLEQDDPDLLKYQELAASPTGSEGMIRDYVDRRPSFEGYDPGMGRKMMSFLLGSLSGGNTGTGYNMAQKHLYAPLEQEHADWKAEGTGITSRARLLDAERQRELTASKYGLQQKARTLGAEARDQRNQNAEARRLAAEVTDEKRMEQNRADRLDSKAFRENMTEQIFDLRQDNAADRKERQHETDTRREEERVRKDEERASKLADPSRINKLIEAKASQYGIGSETADGEDKTHFQMAEDIAMSRAMENPAFADLLVKDKNGDIQYVEEVEGPSMFGNATDEGNVPNAQRLSILRNYIKRQFMKILQGEIE